MTQTRRLTAAQATIAFSGAQVLERDGAEQCSPPAFGIFGHGNAVCLGQDCLQAEPRTSTAPSRSAATSRPWRTSAAGVRPQSDRPVIRRDDERRPGSDEHGHRRRAMTIKPLSRRRSLADTLADRSAARRRSRVSEARRRHRRIDNFAPRRAIDGRMLELLPPAPLGGHAGALTDSAETGSRHDSLPRRTRRSGPRSAGRFA